MGRGIGLHHRLRVRLADAVSVEVERQAETLPRADAVRAALEEYGAIVVVDTLDLGLELLNRIAPEHAELLVAEPWQWLDQVRHCGAVFLGESAGEPVGDYFAGTNHVLPTNGAARYASSLGVGDFVKTTSVIIYENTSSQYTGDHRASGACREFRSTRQSGRGAL